MATPTELVENYNVFIDKAFYSPIVLAGLLGATLSSALGSFVGAPRILLALGEKRILPKSRFLAKTNKKGEPFNAMLVTSFVVVLGLSFRNLNTIAPLITMFFMITYAMVNVVALIEQSLALPSFRPTLKIPLIVPLLGTFGSITVMFIINAAVALTSLVLIVFFYFYLAKKRLKSEVGDSRSGLFTALAGWSTKKTTELSPNREVRSWRPDLLIPVTAPKEIRSCFKLIEDIVAPKGSVKFLAVKSMDTDYKDRLINFLPEVATRLKKRGIATQHTFVDGQDFAETMNISMQALNTAFFKPNTIFIPVDGNAQIHKSYEKVIALAGLNQYGVMLYVPFENVGLSLEKDITVWVKDLKPDWKTNFDLNNNDLSILVSLLLHKNWEGSLHVKVVKNELGVMAEEDIPALRNLIRLPASTTVEVYPFKSEWDLIKSNRTDLNIMPLRPDDKVEELQKIVELARTSAIFCMDTNNVNALV